jgi:hypothetical protein
MVIHSRGLFSTPFPIMSQLVLQNPDLPSDDVELTWVNVSIALTFILVDGTLSLYPPHFPGLTVSCLFDCARTWHREIHPRCFGTMSHPAHIDGTIYISV